MTVVAAESRALRYRNAKSPTALRSFERISVIGRLELLFVGCSESFKIKANAFSGIGTTC